VSVQYHEENYNPMSSLDETSKGTVDVSTFYNDTDGILKEKNVTGLAKKIKVTLPVKGGEGIKCAFYNETS